MIWFPPSGGEQALLVKTEYRPAYGGRNTKEQALLVKTEGKIKREDVCSPFLIDQIALRFSVFFERNPLAFGEVIQVVEN